MPQFIVYAPATSKDGSALGAGIVMVTAANAEAARADGALQLRENPVDLVVVPHEG
jgi:hypothetical protein